MKAVRVKVSRLQTDPPVPVKATRVAKIKTQYKSTTEAEYAAHLERNRLAGMIKWFDYEAFKIRLADGAWYTPDFFVVMFDDTVEIHEVKGRWMEAAKVRFKVAVSKTPFVFRVVKKIRGMWSITDL